MDKRVYGVMVAAMALFLAVNFTAAGQGLPQRIIDILEQAQEDGAGNLDEVMDYYEGLLANPLNINECSAEDLQVTGLFTEFQIISLMEYRREHGNILSWGELSLVDGFDHEVVDLLSYFFRVTDDIPLFSKDYGSRQNMIFRARYKISPDEAYARVTEEEFFKRPNSYYIGLPLYLYGRYKYKGPKGLEAGATLEKDPGETLVPWMSEKLKRSIEAGLIDRFSNFPIDFISAHVVLNDIRIGKRIGLKRVLFGDFSARFGQGLVLWNSFSFSSLSAPSNIYRKEFSVTPYTSADENRFFRGVAFTLGDERWSSSFLLSFKHVDARVDEHNYYSLPTGGYHNTISTIGSRKRLQERVLGVNLGYRGSYFKAGVTFAAYSYDKHNMRRVYPHNIYQMYDGWWGNAALDISFMIRRVRFFGEFAVDAAFSKAWLTGVVWNPSHSFDLSVMVRDYGVKYIATYSGAYSMSSSNSNEQGVIVQVKFVKNNTLITVGADMSHHPWKRYLVDGVSSRVKVQAGLETKLTNSTDVIFRTSMNYDTYSGSVKLSTRLMLKQRVGERFLISSRGDWVYTGVGATGYGYAAYLEGNCSSRNLKFEYVARVAYFCAEDWDNRVYVYERDLPNTFSTSVLYGKGISAFLFIRYRIDSKKRLFLKISSKEVKSQIDMKF